ncbi:glycoside hydrolase family 76 protein [Dothistroma septosporum NZE10]|uniref:Mannan endo-1,6-alpha-mannosidase n=1 Tax=Dothistroma septosporum (strain NZE10 / CBS 128990) TaxID=675120 RepID=N1PSB4_DOTSN|nr:glycoside hydrolase family 76 protein [Dothistroma septosporum NZE10]
MRVSIASGLGGLLLTAAVTQAIELDVNSTDSLVSTSKAIVGNILGLYRNNNSNGNIPGLFGDPYYWWESGLAFDSLINYWAKSGDESVVQTVQDAMLFQVGPDYNYMPPNQSKTLGNDDQASWALAAMTAAENRFPERDGQNVSWVQLATNVFESQVLRWDETSCGGGLKWQIFSFNNGYDYKNSITQGSFALLAARLARYTGNTTYSYWAQKSVEWSYQIGLISNGTGAVFDGTDDTTNCSQINHLQWTMNAGLLIDAGAYMANITQSGPLADAMFWANALWPTISTASRIFTDQSTSANSSGRAILYEVACAPSNNCNADEKAYRARLARALGNARTLDAQSTYVVNGTGVDSYIQRITTILQTSAIGAAAQCSGGDNGTACGSDWTRGDYDGETGLGQDLSALEVILANIDVKQLRTSHSAQNGTTTSSSGGDRTVTQTSSTGGANSTSAASSSGLLGSSTLTMLLAVLFGAASFFA